MLRQRKRPARGGSFCWWRVVGLEGAISADGRFETAACLRVLIADEEQVSAAAEESALIVVGEPIGILVGGRGAAEVQAAPSAVDGVAVKDGIGAEVLAGFAVAVRAGIAVGPDGSAAARGGSRALAEVEPDGFQAAQAGLGVVRAGCLGEQVLFGVRRSAPPADPVLLLVGLGGLVGSAGGCRVERDA